MLCIKNMAALMFKIPQPPDPPNHPPTPPPHPLKIKKKTKKLSWIWILCQNSFTRELKIRFVGFVLQKLFTHDKFQLYNKTVDCVNYLTICRWLLFGILPLFWQFDISF